MTSPRRLNPNLYQRDDDIEDVPETGGPGPGAAAPASGPPAPGGTEIRNEGLPPAFLAELQQRYGAYGRIIATTRQQLTKEEQEALPNVRDERPRYKVTLENGQNQRYNVIVRVARPNTGDFNSIESEGVAPRAEQPARPPQPTPQTPDQAATSAANAQTAAANAAQATEQQRQKERNQKLGRGYLTDDEYEQRLRQREADARAEEAAARASRNETRIAAAQEAQNQIARDRLQFDKDRANQPDVKVEPSTINGQKYTTITRVDKDGKAIQQTFLGPDGKEITSLPREGIELPPDFPRFTPDITKPGAGIYERQRQIDDWMAAHPGKVTWEQRQKILESDIALAKGIATDFSTAASVIKDAYNSQVTQRNQDQQVASGRLTAAQTALQNATALVEHYSPYLGAHKGNAGRLLVGMLASGMGLATLYGGLADQPRVEYPPELLRWAQTIMSGLGTKPSPAADAAASGTPPPIFRPAPVVQDSEIPGTAAYQAAHPSEAAAAAPRPTPGEPGGPPLTNQYPVMNNPYNTPPPTAGEPGGPPLKPGPVAANPYNPVLPEATPGGGNPPAPTAETPWTSRTDYVGYIDPTSGGTVFAPRSQVPNPAQLPGVFQNGAPMALPPLPVPSSPDAEMTLYARGPDGLVRLITPAQLNALPPEQRNQIQVSVPATSAGAGVPEPGDADYVPPPAAPGAGAPTGEPMVTIRNRISGETMAIPVSQWNRQTWVAHQAWEVVPESPATGTPTPPPATPTPPPVAPPPTGTPTPEGTPTPIPGIGAAGGENYRLPLSQPSDEPLPGGGDYGLGVTMGTETAPVGPMPWLSSPSGGSEVPMPWPPQAPYNPPAGQPGHREGEGYVGDTGVQPSSETPRSLQARGGQVQTTPEGMRVWRVPGDEQVYYEMPGSGRIYSRRQGPTDMAMGGGMPTTSPDAMIASERLFGKTLPAPSGRPGSTWRADAAQKAYDLQPLPTASGPAMALFGQALPDSMTAAPMQGDAVGSLIYQVPGGQAPAYGMGGVDAEIEAEARRQLAQEGLSV